MSDTTGTGDNIDRRQALSRLALGGGVVVAGAIAGAGTAAATTSSSGGWKRQTVTFDVACLGNTWRDSDVNYASDASDFRGIPFAVEGWIYPSGHIPIPGDGFVPTQDGSIGRWMCRGSTLVHTQRLEPHVQTTQEFVFGPMSPDDLFAADNITTSGVEGTATQQVARRSVIGGTGLYSGATGEHSQTLNGFNTSIFTDTGDVTPNFIMTFELLLPDV